MDFSQIPHLSLLVSTLLGPIAALEQAENAASKGWSLCVFSQAKKFCSREIVKMEGCFGEPKEKSLQKKKTNDPLDFSI